MRATARLHHPVASFGGNASTHLVVSVTADEVQDNPTRLGLVFVIDRSGSMSQDRKLETVSASLAHLANYLGSGDEIALVSFDSEIKIECEPRSADEAGLAAFTAAVRGLSPRGSTDLDSGLATGIALANQMARADGSRAVRVIVLTDGQANEGICEPEQIASRLLGLAEGVSVSTIGVGLGCNHDLLGLVAERGLGSYGFVESASVAPEVLGAEIGGLLHLAASRVEVRVVPKPGYVVLEPALGVRSVLADDGSLRVVLGNLVSGVTRHLVFPVSLKAQKRANARPVTMAEVAVSGLVDEAQLSIALKPKVHFVAGEAVRDEELDEIVDLARLAAVQREAEQRAAAFDFGGARALLANSSYLSPSVAVLSENLLASYGSQAEYESGTVLRNSMSSMLSPSMNLVGSSAEFTALSSRTVGSFVSDKAREVATETAAAVSSAMKKGSSTGPVTVAGSQTPGAAPDFAASPIFVTGRSGITVTTGNSTSSTGAGLGDEAAGEPGDEAAADSETSAE